MKIKIIVLIILIAGICRVASFSQSDTLLKPQYINIAVLIVDFETYEFEGGSFSYYKRCEGCTNNSIPFIIDYHPPGDFGSIAFKIESTLDTVFDGTIIWMGTGEILYPESFNSEEPFVLSDSIAEPGPVEYFHYDGSNILTDDTYYIPKANSAWESVKMLGITNIFSEKNYRAAIFLYAPAVGAFDPGPAKWIIFLYYNELTFSNTDMKTQKESVEIFPNPCNEVLNIFTSADKNTSFNLEIIALDGKIIKTLYNVRHNIDILDLQSGVYILKYSDGENSDSRLFIKD